MADCILPGLSDANTAVLSTRETDVVNPRLKVGCYPENHRNIQLISCYSILMQRLCHELLAYQTSPRLPFFVRML